MKAVVLEQQGSLEHLKYVPEFSDPVVKPDHVVIRVRASSFNYHDVFTVRGMPGIKVPLPVVVGLDMAGEIAEVGARVAGWEGGGSGLGHPLHKKKRRMGGKLGRGMGGYFFVPPRPVRPL